MIKLKKTVGFNRSVYSCETKHMSGGEGRGSVLRHSAQLPSYL